MKAEFPQLKFTFNPIKPRRGAFEFVVVEKNESGKIHFIDLLFKLAKITTLVMFFFV